MAEAELNVVAARAAEVADRVLASQRGLGLRREDCEDIRSAVLLRLLVRLRRQGAADVGNLDMYVLAATRNAINDFIRHRHPERARLKNRVRYLLTRDGRFALWHSEAGMLCGLHEWDGSATPASPPRLEELPPAVLGRSDERLAVSEIFRRSGAPLLVDDVVALLADAWLPRQDERADADLLPDPAADAATALERRREMAALWREIVLLPQPQRAALLLNLRDAEGANALALIVMLGVAAFDELAGALGLPAERLAELWGELPLDDNAVASLLGLSRQQVINLRTAGRRRLVRRMKT